MWLAKKESKSVAALSWWRRRSILRLEEPTDDMRNFFSEIDRSWFILGGEPRGNWSEDVVGRHFEKLRRRQKFGSALSGRVSKGVRDGCVTGDDQEQAVPIFCTQINRSISQSG
jgi:hypothetical protein